MFGHYARDMTEASKHYLDWSRTGELLLSASHHYSRDEILTRGFIVASIAVCAYFGATQNNEEKTHCSSLTMSIIAALFGFVVSHAIVLIPLVKKRLEMERECQQLVDEIKQVSFNKPFAGKVSALAEHILKLSLSTEQHGNASLTWGTRKRLLACVNHRLRVGNDDPAYWLGSYDELIDKVQQTQPALQCR